MFLPPTKNQEYLKKFQWNGVPVNKPEPLTILASIEKWRKRHSNTHVFIFYLKLEKKARSLLYSKSDLREKGDKIGGRELYLV